MDSTLMSKTLKEPKKNLKDKIDEKQTFISFCFGVFGVFWFNQKNETLKNTENTEKARTKD